MTYAMLIPPLMGILSNSNIAIVAGVGSHMAIKGMATIGVIATFITYSRRFADPLRHFANIYNRIQGAVSPETAMTPEELGLPPMFEMMTQMPGPMSQSGAFVERDGKFYIIEERLNK